MVFSSITQAFTTVIPRMNKLKMTTLICLYTLPYSISGVPRGGGGWGVQTPSEIPKGLQNRAKTQPGL